MVEAEEEYTEQMEILVSCFLRPFKMAASSKKPPCSHEDVNSIFLNSETVLFLHQIFLKGLTSRMECWPTLVLGTQTTLIIYIDQHCFFLAYQFYADIKNYCYAQISINNWICVLDVHFAGCTFFELITTYRNMRAGDLFDMLLPMLSIYQEYVRNHHYSLQVLTECKQSSPPFAALLNRLENKTACHGRSLETFLTYPMHQVIAL